MRKTSNEAIVDRLRGHKKRKHYMSQYVVQHNHILRQHSLIAEQCFEARNIGSRLNIEYVELIKETTKRHMYYYLIDIRGELQQTTQNINNSNIIIKMRKIVIQGFNVKLVAC